MLKPKIIVVSADKAADFAEQKVIAPIRYGESRVYTFPQWITCCMAVSRQAAGIHRTWAFEVIHAYGIYPDGCVAAWLGRRYRKPVIITDVAIWGRWLEDRPSALRRAVKTSRESTFHLAASAAIRDSIAGYAGESEKLRVQPENLDDLYAEAIDRYSWRKNATG